MNPRTIAFLNDLNRRFYERHADAFSATRQNPWPGWRRLLPLLEKLGSVEQLSVLDLGCGNGRFARYLGEYLDRSFIYVGVDASIALLDRARQELASLPHVTLLEHDILDRPLPEKLPERLPRAFDLVTAFGLLHHVPGFELRGRLLSELVSLLAPGGILALAFWQFARHERFRQRILPWTALRGPSDASLQVSDLEAGDYLLSWAGRPGVFRYCHFADPDEASRLVASLPVRVVNRFYADGQTGDLNLYYVLAAEGFGGSAIRGHRPLSSEER